MNVFAAVLSLLFLTLVIDAQAQSSRSTSVDEIKDMITRSRNRDERVSDKAKEELSALRADSIPNLFIVLKNEKPCDAVVAAMAISDLDPNYPELVAEITKLVRDVTASTRANPIEEGMCRRGAAFLLPASAEGLRSILELLKKGDTWEQQTAIFALDDFTEVGAYNERPGEIPVMKEIVPVLARLQNSENETINVMSTEVLIQISGKPPKELALLAKKLIDD